MRLFKLIFTMLALLFITSCVSNGLNHHKFNQDINGVYKGVIWSGGEYAGATTFSVHPDNSISGVYTFHNNLKGTLSGCKRKADITRHNLRCTWKDKYGSGILDIKFSKDYSSFSGNWFLSGENEKYPWNGKK